MDSGTLHSREIGALVTLIDQRRLREAEDRARSLLAAHPNVGMLWKILGVSLLRQGKDALQALHRTTELLPQDAEAHGNLGAALCDRGQWGHALASLLRALALRPQDTDALVDAGNALQALGRAREAIPLYERALQLQPGLVQAHNNLGNALVGVQRYRDAAECYRRALERSPRDAQILCNLGMAQRQLGLLDEALSSTRHAIALEPSLSAAHNHLGLVLAARGQREEAAASYRQALQLNPRDVEALTNLGNVLRELGMRREALSCYARAVELDPGRIESHCNLGNVLVELHRTEEAGASFRRALALEPRSALAHVSLATVLRLQRRAAEAESSCEAALAIDPNHLEALHLRGELHADRGRFPEAHRSFERALAIDPHFAPALAGTAIHRRMTQMDHEWRRRAEVALAQRQALKDEIGLRHALGKYFDDVGDYDQAFDSHRRANDMTRRHGSAYDRQKLTARVDRLIDTFDAGYLGGDRPQASASELPVFVLGMPRSGTSLAEQILASHPAIAGAGELPFWDAAFDAYQAEAESSRERRRGGAQGDNLLPGFAADYLDRLTAVAGGAARVVDKMPANFWYGGLIHAALPNARIIHMQRHPLDTCVSIYFQRFHGMDPYAVDLDNLAHYYGEYLRVTDHWRAVLPATALLEVPYEALIADQEGWTRRMLSFVGLPWDPACLEFHRTDRIVITASKWQVRQKIHAGSVGRFKHYRKFLGPLEKLLDRAPQRYSEGG